MMWIRASGGKKRSDKFNRGNLYIPDYKISGYMTLELFTQNYLFIDS